MTSTKTIRGLLAATLLIAGAAAPAFAQGGAADNTPAASANRPAATPATGAATQANRPATTAPVAPSGAAQRSTTIAPAERGGSAVTPGTGAGTTAPSGPVQGSGATRTN